MGMMGLGYDRGQYTSGHAPQHGMLRQKSIGEAVCFFRLPLSPPVCLSSGPVEVYTVLTCLSVANNVSSVAKKCAHFLFVSVAYGLMCCHLFNLLYLYCKNKMLVCLTLTLLLLVIYSSATNLLSLFILMAYFLVCCLVRLC